MKVLFKMANRDRLRRHVQGQLWKGPLEGKGKFGKVYEVSGLDGEKFILKVSGFEDATEKEEQYFIKEVDTLRRFEHPHIIKYIDGWDSRNEGTLSVYLLTEYATGGDLKTYLYQELKKPPPEVTYGSWLTQIASGLEFIHSMGVIHRNLKTSNIFVDIQETQLVLKIGDFGMSIVLNSPDAMAKSFVGTPYFISPEMFNRIPYNTKTDVWSFGCTAFEIATLTTAFEPKTMTALISAVNKYGASEVTEKIKYGDFFKTLVGKMLQKDYRRRPDAGTVLQTLLDKGYTSMCSIDATSTSQSHKKDGTKRSSSTSSSFSKTKVKEDQDGSSRHTSKPRSSSLADMGDESMAVYPVSNPHWGEIDKRSVKSKPAMESSKCRQRTRSEGGPPPETAAALASFSEHMRRKSHEERLSKSGPVKSVSFDTPRTDTSGYNSEAETCRSSQADLTESEDEADQAARDEERVVRQVTRLQSSLSQTLGDAVFQVAFNTLRIRDEEERAKELESVLGDKYDEFGLQFTTLRRLERRCSDYEMKAQSLNKTI